MLLAKPLPLFPFTVPVENLSTGEKAVLQVQAVCALDGPAAGAHAAFIRLGWHHVKAWPATPSEPGMIDLRFRLPQIGG